MIYIFFQVSSEVLLPRLKAAPNSLQLFKLRELYWMFTYFVFLKQVRVNKKKSIFINNSVLSMVKNLKNFWESRRKSDEVNKIDFLNEKISIFKSIFWLKSIFSISWKSQSVIKWLISVLFQMGFCIRFMSKLKWWKAIIRSLSVESFEIDKKKTQICHLNYTFDSFVLRVDAIQSLFVINLDNKKKNENRNNTMWCTKIKQNKKKKNWNGYTWMWNENIVDLFPFVR